MDSQVIPWWFNDEELREATRNLTFHIATGTLEEMKAKSWILVSQQTEYV